MVTYDKEYENIILCVDTKCPYVQKIGTDTIYLSAKEAKINGVCPYFLASLPRSFVMPYQSDAIKIATIKNLNGFKALALEHKNIFDEYLGKPEYSARSFANIYIWSDLFNILWKIIDKRLCVFYEYKNEFNMLLPAILPLAKLPQVLRIENISEDEVDAFKNLGLKIDRNTDEYIYLAEELAQLKGNKFASHRAAVNQFSKKYLAQTVYRPFDINDIDECLNLYLDWVEQRKRKKGDCPIFSGLSPFFQNTVYAQLIDESFSAHKKAMMNYKELGLIGKVVEINNEIRAYTFAFKLNDDTYCIMLETADLSIKGLTQFILRKICRELSSLGAKYINAMDDSGLANLRKIKLSYHPFKILTTYIAPLS